MPAQRFVLTQSWWLAALMVRRHPELKLIETHPGGGQYDCLTLVRNQKTLISINRQGGIHIFSEAATGRGSMVTSQLLDEDDVTAYPPLLEKDAGLKSPAKTPASTPAVLTYRTIAQVMAITLNDRHRWDVRNAFLDTSDMGGGPATRLLQPFPIAAERAREERADDLLGIPFYRYWCLLREGKPVAVLDTDGFVYVGKQVIHLPDVYSAHSRRLTPTVAAVLGGILP